MATTCEYRGAIQTFFDDQTFETVHPMAPVIFEDDFLGYQAMLSETGSTGPWLVVNVNLNTAPAVVADEPHGAIGLIMDSDNNAEDAVLYWGDQRGIDVSKGAVFEARVRLAATPTATGQAVFGMAGDHNLAKDSVAENAWFKFDGSAAVVVETDDTTNDNDDVATGVTVTNSEYKIYRIDFTDLSSVKFYIDGARVAASTTFDMSNLSASEAIMQPYFSLDKDADTGVGTLYIDYVKVWSRRS